MGSQNKTRGFYRHVHKNYERLFPERVVNGARPALVIGIILAVFLFANSCFAQFMVQPMKLELTPLSGAVVNMSVRLQNYGTVPRLVELRLVELTQWENGVWRTIDPNSNFDTSKLASCKKWITVKGDNFTVPGLAVVPVPITLRVPRRVRGFHAAAIEAILRAPPGVIGVAMTYRFVIPVLVEVQGRAMRHEIELRGTGLEFAEASEKDPARTLVSVSVVNDGGTFSRLNAFARVRGFRDGYWREITQIKLEQCNITPGVALVLRSDIGRSLPSGKYKVEGALYVDGRRGNMLEKEIDYVGDPSVKTVATDAPLFLNPTEVTLDGVAGGTRTGTIKVYNASEDMVNVKMDLEVPPFLRGIALGEVMGTDLVCVEWVQIEPEQFTLRPSEEETVQIISKLPKEAPTHAWYYALLRIRTTYKDGQNAGVKTAPVCVGNKTVETKPGVQPVKVTVGLQEGSKYIVVGRFWNVGNIHLTPKCRASVATPQGTVKAAVALSGDPGLMLPLEIRDFSEVIDFSTIAAGYYRLMVALEYGPKEPVVGQIPIQVSVEGGQKVVQVVGTEEFEKIGVKW